MLDAGDAADVIDLVREEHGAAATGRRFPKKATLLDLYSRSVNTQRPLSAVIDEVAPWCADQLEPIASICRAYVNRKRVLGLVDFDDLLLYWRAAAADDRLGPQLASEIDHICVDEYQDVNALQVDVLRALRRTDPRLTVVGDDSQAVYGFRGASPRHLLDIESAFPAISDDPARTQLPVDPADPRRRQRDQRRRARRFHGAAARRAGRSANGRASCAAPTKTRRSTRSATRSWRTAKKASRCASRRCWSAPRTTATSSSSSSRTGASRT